MPVTFINDAGPSQAGFGAANPFPVVSVSPGLAGSPATAIIASSGNVAAATATATLPGVAGKTTYISGFEFTAGGATSAAVVTGTLTGILGGTISYIGGAPTGAGVPAPPLVVEFSPPLPASAVNTAIVVSFPSLGAGNTNACVTAHGFQQ